MDDLELALRAIAEDVRYPQTPDMTQRVMDRVQRAPVRGPIASRSRLVFALAAAAMIAVALVAAVSIWPSARRAVAEWLGVDGISITFDEGARDVPTIVDPQLGKMVSADEAAAEAVFDILVPAELGEPDRYYLSRDVEGGEVSLVWEPGPGLPESRQTGFGAVLTQFVGEAAPEFIKKTAVSGTSVRFVSVAGREGYFIKGTPHLLVRERDGDERTLSPRLAGNTLIWDGGEVTYRLEADVPLDRAVEIAQSMS